MVALNKSIRKNEYKFDNIVRVYADGKTEFKHGVIDKEKDPLLFCNESQIYGTAIENQYDARWNNPLK